MFLSEFRIRKKFKFVTNPTRGRIRTIFLENGPTPGRTVEIDKILFEIWEKIKTKLVGGKTCTRTKLAHIYHDSPVKRAVVEGKIDQK